MKEKKESKTNRPRGRPETRIVNIDASPEYIAKAMCADAKSPKSNKPKK